MLNRNLLAAKIITLCLSVFVLFCFSCKDKTAKKLSLEEDQDATDRVIIGAERLLNKDFFSLVEGKRVGLLTNHTGVFPNGQHIIDALNENPQVELTLLFGPEHGLRGEEDHTVADGTDPKTGLPIISLYGELRKPTPDILAKVDVIVFDIQDIGTRFYTYIKTMLWMQEAAAENNLPFIVLDRPNPIGGTYVDGPIEPIAINGAIPITHGMTVGELAKLFNAYRKDAGLPTADLTVVPMLNYQREFWYDDTGLPWIKPSPNMLTLTTATVYPATCLIEGSNISEGRGTMHPFEQVGAPWIDAKALANKMSAYNLKGVKFKASQFIPDSIVDGLKIYPPKFLSENCSGVSMEITNREEFKSAQVGVYIFHALMSLYPERFEFRDARFDKLLGTPEVRKKLQRGESPEKIVQSWQSEIKTFKNLRQKYLLY